MLMIAGAFLVMVSGWKFIADLKSKVENRLWFS